MVMLLTAAAVMLVAAGLLALPGSPSRVGGIAATIERLIVAGGLAALWIAGAAGLGRLLRPLWGTGVDEGASAALQGGTGIALALWVAHLLGAVGAYGWGPPAVVAWAPIALGVALLAHQARHLLARRLTPPWTSWHIVSVAVPLGLLIVAAAIPPGGIWATEARGYDVLSYHLQLPKEWLATGRIAPLEHNVYSFLPSYVEAAYAQVAAMVGVTAEHPLGSGEGVAIYAAQWLHALLAVSTSVVISVLVIRIAQRLGDPLASPHPAHAIGAAAVFIATPWVIITASHAYNEMGVLLCTATALLAAVLPISPGRRWLACGLLVGVAVAAKPAAMVTAAPIVAVTLVATTAPRLWPVCIAAAVIGGLAAVAPWLIRNAVALGNPIFPYATSLFGSGHWTPEQVHRWTAAHEPTGTMAHRLGLLLSARGILHQQWALVPLIGAVCAGGLLAATRWRRAGLVILAAMAASILGWLLLTHLQSRFLVSLSVPASVAIGLAGCAIEEAMPRRRHVVRAGPPVIGLLVTIASVLIYLEENGGRPAITLPLGVRWLNGTALDDLPPGMPPAERAEIVRTAGPWAAANHLLPEGAVLVLVGDATPLYLRPEVRYSTTWDASPLGDALEAAGGDVDAAAGMLRDAGVTHLLVNLAEVDRLTGDGWHDPRITPDDALLLAARWCDPIETWPEAGIVLGRLRETPNR